MGRPQSCGRPTCPSGARGPRVRDGSAAVHSGDPTTGSTASRGGACPRSRSTADDPAERFIRRQTPIQRIHHVLHAYPALSPAIVLVLACIVFGLLNPRFFLPENLSLIGQQVAVVGGLAVGQTIIILTAGIDLSVGAVMVFTSIVMAGSVANFGVPGPVALVVGLVVGTLAGGLNGLLVTRLRLPPFIVTLGTLNIFTALTLLYSGGQTDPEPGPPGHPAVDRPGDRHRCRSGSRPACC